MKGYSSLRNISGLQGSEVNIVGPLTAGKFKFSATDPYGNGDDDGIVIKGSKGYWIRSFAHTAIDPIQLDWFGVGHNTNITQKLKKLAATFSPKLFVLLPSNIELYLDHINLTGTEYFHLITKGGKTIINQLNQPAHDSIMLQLDNYQVVSIDSGIEFRGKYDLLRDPGLTGGLLSFNLTQPAISFDCHCDITDSPVFGLNHTGGEGGSPNKALNANITGRYDNSGVRVNSGLSNLNINVHVLDPRAGGVGYDSSDGTTTFANYEKFHGAWMQNIDALTGQVILEHGGAQWFMSGNKAIGTSAIDPFIIDDRNLSHLPDGTLLPETTGMRKQTGKIDSLANPQPAGTRFMKIVSDGNNALQYGFILEATPESSASNYYTNNIDVEFVNAYANRSALIGEIAQAGTAIGQVQGINMRGEVNGLIIMDSLNSCNNLTFTTLEIRRNANQTLTRPDNISIVDSTMSGDMLIKAGQDITIDNLLVPGPPRNIINIANATEIDPITVNITNMTTPVGSTITADNDSLVTVTVDSVAVTLPYTF